MKITAAIAIAISTALVFAQSVRRGAFEVVTLSARADMVSGGDVLIRITAPVPAASNVVMTVNGQAPNAEFEPTTPPTTLTVRLKDLKLGKNAIDVGLKGQKPAVQLVVVNHPIDLQLWRRLPGGLSPGPDGGRSPGKS